MFIIENEILVVSVKSKGAELDTIFSKETKMEYLWDGDPTFWPKKSPVLFPIVGTLKNNSYTYNDKSYKLTRHGFARDMDFECSQQDSHSITMTLVSNNETLAAFPFQFRLDIIYSIAGNGLTVTYKVTNPSSDEMYFSIGGHPAFRIPMEEGLDYEDYFLEFNNTEDARRWLISSEGLIEPNTVPLITNDTKLPLTKELFSKDALVFKYLNSDTITLKTEKSTHGLTFSFQRFPFIGLWAAPGADFVCIEPWCGIADSTLSDQQFMTKEGIELLTGNSIFQRHWSVQVY